MGIVHLLFLAWASLAMWGVVMSALGLWVGTRMVVEAPTPTLLRCSWVAVCTYPLVVILTSLLLYLFLTESTPRNLFLLTICIAVSVTICAGLIERLLKVSRRVAWRLAAFEVAAQYLAWPLLLLLVRSLF